MPTVIEPGAVIDGKYRVLRRIGEGGMGVVYEGENVRIERRVAIKVLHEHVASSPEFAQRFEHEARASARIGSPHVCDVLDLGDLPNGERFIVMEFLDGESLEDRLERRLLTAEELAPIAFQILEGLGTMHQAGVIHRDLKPANVFLARIPRKTGEVVKILDFGVAKIVARADQPNEMTSTGMMMGTPLYMSPEQARGARDVDGRTDIYAASVIFYRALTGEMPHVGANLHELLFKIVLEDPKPIVEIVPGVDPELAAIVTKGLARDADLRFSSAREYQEEIAAWGRAKGRADLLFSVTLSNEPPPLRALSGGYPAALIKAHTPVTGPTLQPERVGPPTPQGARTQSATPSARQSGGTPTAWADDAPEIAKRALAEIQDKRPYDSRPVTGGNTQVIDSRRSPPVSESFTPSHVGAPVADSPRRRGAWPALGAGLALLVGAGLGARHYVGAKPGTAAVSSATSVVEPASAPVVSAAEPAVADPSSVPASSLASEAEPPAVPTEAPPSHAPTHRATTRGTTPAGRAPAPPVASAAAPKTPASVATATTATTPAPGPSPVTTSSSGHRKFRTNLE